jgi:hypothetical protein
LARTIAMGGILLVGYFAGRALRQQSVDKFQLLLVTEGLFLLGTALMTASGRVTLGVGQAGSSRYQTPAMLFWATLAALCLLWVEQQKPRFLPALQMAILVPVLLSGLAAPSIYKGNAVRAQGLREACQAVAAGQSAPELTKRLSDRSDLLEQGGEFLRSIWNKK